MKKSLFSALIITTTTLVPTLASLATDCPSIPETLKAVTVKDNNATLRTEPKKSSEKGSPIVKGNKLGVIDNKPTQDSEGNDYCWYKVKFLKGSDAKQYWIASIGLEAWPITPPSPTPTPSVSPTPGGISTHSSEILIPWMVWVLASIGIIVLSLFTYDIIKKRGYFNNPSHSSFDNTDETDNSSSSNLDTTTTNVNQNTPSSEQSLHLIASMAQEYLPKIVKLVEENVNQDLVKEDLVKEVHKIKSTVTKQDREIGQLKAENSELKAENSELKAAISELKAEKESSIETDKTEHKKHLDKSFENSPSEGSTTTPESKNQDDKKEWEKLVDEFNKRNKDYFTPFNPQFLKLDIESLNAKPNWGGSPIVKLIRSSDSNEPYLKIQINNENWLFPNILLTQVDKIISSLKTSIFTRDSDSNNPQLKKPAKLKEVSPGIWEIAERGEFM